MLTSPVALSVTKMPLVSRDLFLRVPARLGETGHEPRTALIVRVLLCIIQGDSPKDVVFTLGRATHFAAAAGMMQMMTAIFRRRSSNSQLFTSSQLSASFSFMPLASVERLSRIITFTARRTQRLVMAC